MMTMMMNGKPGQLARKGEAEVLQRAKAPPLEHIAVTIIIVILMV